MTSYLSSLIWGTSQVDDAVDKATSELLPSGSEDIALNLEISDQIRSKSVSPKDAMRALKRRLNHKNPNVQLLALGLTDTCIKNGGDLFLVEIASREFMDNLVSILKMPALNHDVKNKILRLVQNWALAFEGRPSLSYVGEVYRTLQREGFTFPPQDLAATSSAMVDTQTAPEWIDSDVCLRCRTAFTFTNRKHHCRNCGQVFDQQCSSKTMPLPHFGITQEVRVCDSCYTKLNKATNKIHRSSQSVSGTRHRSARDLADAELQRAIQLSLEEVGAAGGRRPGYVPSASPWQSSEPPLVDRKTHPYASSPRPNNEEEEDPDLKAAIEASLREANALRPSAPLGIETSFTEQQSYGQGYGFPQSYPPSAATPKPRAPAIPNYDLEPLEADAILTFNQTVDQVQSQGATDLSRYPAVTELYDKANALRPKLAMSLNDTGRKEQILQEMHEKLSQAVKLYDNLLTEQVSRPAWRAPSTAPSTSYQQQANAGYAPQYHTGDGYHSQWAPEPHAQQAMSPRTQAHTQGGESSYFATAPRESAPNPNGAYVTSPAAERYSMQSYQSQPMVASLQQPSSPSQYSQYSRDASQHAVGPPPVTIPQYGVPAPTPPQLTAPYPPPVSQPPTISAPQPHQLSQPSVPQPPRPVIIVPPTISSPPPSVNGYLPRHNTASHGSQQLHQLQQLAAPPQLPNFPVVPTTSPQSYAAYATPMSGTVETERKEALLIDL